MSTAPNVQGREVGGIPPWSPKPAPAAFSAGAPADVHTARPAVTRIGKYEVEREVGGGTRVRVFRALDRDTGRPVTLKVLTDIADRLLHERFRREVAAAARLRHPAIVSVYELGEHVGLPFAALQYLEG